MKVYAFLEKQFLKEHPETLDDDMSDKFAKWLFNKDRSEILEYFKNVEIIEK